MDDKRVDVEAIRKRYGKGPSLPMPSDPVKDINALCDEITRLQALVEWRPIVDVTPYKDGRSLLLRMRHFNYQLAKSAEEKSHWEEIVVAKWIDHNGGGWTWHGICGQPIDFCLITPPESKP